LVAGQLHRPLDADLAGQVGGVAAGLVGRQCLDRGTGADHGEPLSRLWDMRVLVAGGAGYIGSVVTAALLADGAEVTVLDDLSTGHADAVPSGARFVAASLYDSAPV